MQFIETNLITSPNQPTIDNNWFWKPRKESKQTQILNEIVKKTIEYITLHPVKLSLIFRFLDGSYREELTKAINEININHSIGKGLTNVENFVEALDWDTVILPDKTLNFISEQYGNTDIRGGGCGINNDFDTEDFEWTVSGDHGITLKQLGEAVYRLKGSKYDYWYELFSGLREFNENGEKGYVVEFDYGS